MTNTKKYFIYLCLLHLTIWTLAPALFQKNGALDVVEAIAWGSQWQLGYDRDPFLVAWLAKLVSTFGGSTLWSIYLFSQLCVITCFWAVWQLAQEMKLSAKHALMAVIFLEGIFYYHFTTPEFNDNVLQLPMWTLMTLFFYRALRDQKLFDWGLTGLFLALAMLAKYFTIMLVVPMAAVCLFTENGRTSLKQPGIYFSAAISALIFAPNLIWQQQHDWSYIHYALHRADVKPSFSNHLWYPTKFFVAQLVAVLPALILFFIFINRGKPLKNKSNFDSQFLTIMSLGPFATTLFYAAFTGTQMRSMWGTPLFSLLGLFLVYYFTPQTNNLKKYFTAFASFFVVSLLGYVSLVTVSPYFLGYAKNEFFPSQQMAQDLTKLWHDQTGKPLTYVAGPRRLAARINVYSHDHPTPFFDWNKNTCPWISDEQLHHKGALFLWDAKKNNGHLPDYIIARYPGLKGLKPHEYSWQTHAEGLSKVAIGVAILPPIR